MPARRSRATDRVKERTIQALLPEMVIRAGTPVTREGEPVTLRSPDRDLVPVRDLYAPLATETILESAGGRPELVWHVDRWDILYGTARRGRTLAGRDPSLQFRDPGCRQPLQAEVEVRLRQ